MIESKIDQLIASLDANTQALRDILSAGSTAPTSEPAKVAKKQAKTKLEVVEPEPAAEETPTKVEVAAAPVAEGLDPLDKSTTPCDAEGEPVAPKKVDPNAVITEITETWKSMLTSADADRKVMLKDKFPELREKWGLKEGDKLVTLAPTPEKLVGLLADIKKL